jgi:hypothetical protein
MAVLAPALVALALGGFTLGESPRTIEPIDATLFGCPGTAAPLVIGGRVAAVRYEVPPDGRCAPGDDVDPDVVFARVQRGIAKTAGAPPDVHARGVARWNGAHAAVIEVLDARDPPWIVVWLVPR